MSWSFTASPLPFERCKACAEHRAPRRLFARLKKARKDVKDCKDEKDKDCQVKSAWHFPIA
jgi:hypothetical protein